MNGFKSIFLLCTEDILPPIVLSAPLNPREDDYILNLPILSPIKLYLIKP